MIEQFKTARKRAVPLVCIRTSDAKNTANTILQNVEAPIIQWDITAGMIGLNPQGTQAAKSISRNVDSDTQNPTECLVMAQKLPEFTILIMLFGHMFFESESYVIAMWKLRDMFKYNKRQLVLLCPSVKLPPEISSDFLILDDPLPDEAAIATMVNRLETDFQSTNESYAIGNKSKVASAVLGLAAFPAEQALYMAADTEGINLEVLAEKKRQIVEAAGASIHRGKETFKDVSGNEAVISLLRAELNGKRPPRVIVYADEIEKAIGTDLDTSGTSQSMKGLLLSWMEDFGVRAMLCTGVPGTGKSLLYKAAAGEAQIPGIGINLSQQKGSLVGQSEANLTRVLQMVTAMGQGEVYMIATANNIGILPPEMRSRFYATFFFDLTTEAERNDLWNMYTEKYGLVLDDLPDSHNWVGREVRNCCDIADRLNIPLKKAAEFIVPVAISSAETINRMREEAAGRYLSASYPGPYQIESASERALRKAEL